MSVSNPDVTSKTIAGESPKNDPESVMEAIKLLKDWSNILLVVQTGAIAFIGTVMKDAAADMSPLYAWAAIASIGCFVVSIVAAANLIASLPSLAHRRTEIRSIYNERGNLRIRIQTSAQLQGGFFVVGIAVFGLFAAVRILGT